MFFKSLKRGLYFVFVFIPKVLLLFLFGSIGFLIVTLLGMVEFLIKVTSEKPKKNPNPKARERKR